MSYPVDQIVTLTKANGQLLSRLAEIAKAVGEDYAGIGKQELAGAVDRFKAIEPGKLPTFFGGSSAELFAEIQKTQEAAAGKVKAAFEEWQAIWKDTITNAGSENVIGSFQKLITPWFGSDVPAKPDTSVHPASKKSQE